MMNNPTNIQTPLTSSLAPDPALRPKNRLQAWYLHLKKSYLRRSNRRILLALSDDQLKDIGISRSDIMSSDNPW
ncbi:DUF1127 domain-containing protein [Acerihabitans sp. TG2]|uniref:DUF1127 domain-containing protein n=1 Tax=Acerihabitans sp. TG2 TaxID=3096008 RepID=UPI002B229CA6|nr:DUF1127 domain-containing protein [Acerihabitans sp. TG2]MEA9390884.1 DUF1127 domain-containing protein [Acerihabitans sp. TG2]